MPLDPVTASALITTGGSLFSGLLNKGKSNKSRWNESIANLKLSEMAQKQDMRLKMDLAKKYKIHPLTMLGVNPSFGAPVFEGKGDSTSMGQNVVNALTKGASQYFTGKQQAQMNDLALENAQLQNELLKSQITSINNPSQAGNAYSNDQRVIGQTDETALPAFIKVRNRDGSISEVPNSQAVEGIESSGIVAGTIESTKFAYQNYIKAYGQKLGRELYRMQAKDGNRTLKADQIKKFAEVAKKNPKILWVLKPEQRKTVKYYMKQKGMR